MFVANYILSGGKTRQYHAGIFYTCTDYIYGFEPPCGALMRPLPLRCSSTGKTEPFFYYNFRRLRTKQSVMNYTEKTCSGVKYSTLVSTDDARKAFQERFPLVRNLKIKQCKFYFNARAKYGKRKLFCHAYKSWEALLVRFAAEYADKVLAIDVHEE